MAAPCTRNVENTVGKLVANALVTLDVKDSLDAHTCDNAASGGYGAEQSIKISWSEKEVSVN